MAPPLVKGRALLYRRIAGIAFLIVLGLLVELSIAMYQKKFTDTIDVALETSAAGNQLSVHADVKVRGVLVGEVRKVSSNGERALLELALKPDMVALVPKNVKAQLLPKTLFGEKEVALIIPADASTERISQGDRITQDRSTTALETEEALNNTLPLLKSLEPQQLALTLNALSEGLRGRGDQLGRNLELNAAYLRQLNPSLPTLAQDLQGLADFANTTSEAAPDLLRTLDNLAFSGRSLVAQRAALEGFLQSTKEFASSATSVVADNERRFVDLARDSLPSLQLYAAYSDTFPCLLNRVAFSEIEGERVFGGGQPGLHITVEVIEDNGGFVTGDEPQYKEKRNAHCFGLGPNPIRPFPEYANPQDGYRDSDPPRDPGTGPDEDPAAWVRPLTTSPTQSVVRRQVMPRGTTEFEALMLAPLTGSGS